MAVLCALIVLVSVVRPATGDENAPVFSYGSGPYELIIFSDYFCTPCQKMEKELDKTISGMIGRGGVKITFVDYPIFKLTPLYARYFLYAVNASASYKDALRARQFLFKKASSMGAITAEHLERDLKSEGIAIKPYDTKVSFDRYDALIKKYSVRSTPTFIFVYSATDIRRYSGSEPVRKGMAELLRLLETR
jgi:thiol:disulfide interchange protein DsbA